jgi:hypothetical protein
MDLIPPFRDGVNYNVTRGLRRGQPRKSESIRTTLSDLDPQLVTNRETGLEMPCFHTRRTVKRSVFPSKRFTSSYVGLCLRRHIDLLTIKLRNDLGVDVTEEQKRGP